jgi:hypothetical protein
MNAHKTIVCFAGGTSGDLVVSVLDPKNCDYNPSQGKVKISKDRSVMKKFWQFTNTKQKKDAIKNGFENYDSLPSHDVDFHIDHGQDKVIGITCFDKDLRDRSATRFKNLHSNQVWDSLTKVSKTETIEQYSDDILQISRKLERAFTTIDLKEIIKGNLISRLTEMEYTISDESLEIYKKWMAHHSGG